MQPGPVRCGDASPEDDIPADGPALDRWIAASGRTIELIIWDR